MKNQFARIRSDYCPETCMLITRSDDGDVAIKIIGDGEMRIATNGSRYKGNDLVNIVDAFQNLINVIAQCEEV